MAILLALVSLFFFLLAIWLFLPEKERPEEAPPPVVLSRPSSLAQFPRYADPRRRSVQRKKAARPREAVETLVLH